MADLIIGSGPSGVSVAKALLDRGRTVVMLDAGKTLEEGPATRRDTLANTSPTDWSATERDGYQAPQFETPPGQARRYGSDFAMEPAEATLTPDSAWLGLRASQARGGLSNLWGSAVLPNRQADIADWPINEADLAPHYRAVAEFLPVAGVADDLEALFPALPMAGRHGAPSSPQAQNLLDRAAKTDLSAHNLHIGKSRVAVEDGCQSCAMCLHGCPWSLIYSAAHSLRDLEVQRNFTYRADAVVQQVEERSTDVRVTLANGEPVMADRVFLACGVLETARLILRSRPDLQKLTLKDSQHGFIPMLHRWSVRPRPDQLPTTTLPQIFAELDDPAVSPFLVHAQIYSWNEHYLRDLMANYGRKIPGSAPLWKWMARRLIVAQAFLHSDHSARIGLSLTADGLLKADHQKNPQTEVVFAAARKALAPAMSKLGLTTLGFATRLGGPGSSFHVGGSLPMRRHPQQGESDGLGRPAGFDRVHVVDASVLPSIPATTITFSVMANAHRIGALAP